MPRGYKIRKVNKKPFIILFLLIPALLSAQEKCHISFSLGAGAELDIAPFGLEKKYLTLQGSFFIKGSAAAGIIPGFSFSRDAFMAAVPLVAGIPFHPGKGTWEILPYGGAGGGYLRGYDRILPLFTAGIMIQRKHFFINPDILIFIKDGESDTFAGIKAGFAFN